MMLLKCCTNGGESLPLPVVRGQKYELGLYRERLDGLFVCRMSTGAEAIQHPANESELSSSGHQLTLGLSMCVVGRSANI